MKVALDDPRAMSAGRRLGVSLRWLCACLVLARIAAAGTADAFGGSRAARDLPRAHLLVYAQEWSLWPSRAALPAGRVSVQLWNRGQDAHDLRIRRLSHGAMIGRAQGVVVTQSGGLSQASWRLAPGRYELYCSLAGHLKLGMHAVLVVR